MVRISAGRASRQKHKNILKLAKGYWMSRSKQFKKAQEAVLHAGEYAFAGRKLRKRNMRKLWITRINAALGEKNVKYSDFINILKTKKIEIDRKILAQLVLDYPKIFDAFVQQVIK